MKKLFIMAAALACAAAQAHPHLTNEPSLNIHRHTLGSGEQGVKGFENATPVLQNDIFHAPQYMPYFPTAATIWPRVIEVDCVRATPLKCEGYNWAPSMGRAEYLFVTPRVRVPAKPVVVEKIVTVPGPERIKEVLVEVPPKKARE